MKLPNVLHVFSTANKERIYVGYSCTDYECNTIAWVCEHRHTTPREAAKCVWNPCLGYVAVFQDGKAVRLTDAEIAEIEAEFRERQQKPNARK